MIKANLIGRRRRDELYEMSYIRRAAPWLASWQEMIDVSEN
jgi:hypothetical protein